MVGAHFSYIRRALGYTWAFVFACLGRIALAQPVQLHEKIDWMEIKPGGDTLCARGEEFSFFVSPGSQDKVVVDFIGGGACWSPETCAKDTATFVDSVDYLRKRYKKGLDGIYDRNHPDNPLKEWTHVVVPYCTGDIHWGKNEQTYTKKDGQQFVIHHKGAVNAQAVLDWVRSRITAPKKVLVTGCSAGAYGSIYWAPAIREMYPQSAFYQLGDSGAGIVTDSFYTSSFPKWNATASVPAWIPGLDPRARDWTQLNIVDLYRIIGSHYPSIKLAQFNTAVDDIQTFYYEIMGGQPENWSAYLFDKIQAIKQTTANFNHYTAPGHDHCILPYDRFYTMTSAGVSFKTWFEKYLADEPIDSVTCDACDPDGVGQLD